MDKMKRTMQSTSFPAPRTSYNSVVSRRTTFHVNPYHHRTNKSVVASSFRFALCYLLLDLVHPWTLFVPLPGGISSRQPTLAATTPTSSTTNRCMMPQPMNSFLLTQLQQRRQFHQTAIRFRGGSSSGSSSSSSSTGLEAVSTSAPEPTAANETAVTRTTIGTTMDVPTRTATPKTNANTIVENTTTSSATTSTTTTTASGASNATRLIVDNDDFVRPERDLRRYRMIELDNGLRVLLVSDPVDGPGHVGVEAAAVHVQAGHFDDPATAPGLAHFHEHMVFLGTSKYPNEDDYESFLSQYGGSANAFTDMEDTNYYFSITTEAKDGYETKVSDGLQGGLDRLAQFFIDPIFDRNAVEREIKSIDSEYRNAITSDSWRNYQLLKSTCNPDHPFAKFGCGNYQTLSGAGFDSLLDEMKQFWATYYRTYNMRLAVVGHSSLDAIQRAVEQTFGTLPYSEGQHRRNHKTRPGQFFPAENAVYGVEAYGPEQLGVLRKIIPFSEMRMVKLYFAFPPIKDPVLDKTKSYRVLSHLLGHESKGSLHALLNEEGYITDLSSGVAIDTSDFCLFSLSLTMTKKGMDNYEKILDLMFQWISLVKEVGDDQMAAYADEVKKMEDISFRFRENGDPTGFCSSAAEALFDDLPEPGRFLIAANDSEDYDPVVTRRLLDRFRPSNCMISIVSSDFSTKNDNEEWKVEKWYGAQFHESKLSPEQMKKWSSYEQSDFDPRLHLPELNRYIPTGFSLRCNDEVVQTTRNTAVESKTAQDGKNPLLLVDKPELRLWHKMDRTWLVPKTFIRISLQSSSTYQSPRSMTLNRLFLLLLNDDLNSYVYDANVAGCSYRITCVPTGYRITVRGFSEKLPFMFDALTTRILSLIREMKEGTDTVLRAKFDKAVEGLLRETRNFRIDSPYEIANYNSRLVIEEKVWYLDNYIKELELDGNLSMEECGVEAERSFVGRVKCEALCMGNINEEGANEVAKLISEHFLDNARTLSEAELPTFRSLKLPTVNEAVQIFGPAVANKTIPLVYQELAFSETEENNAVEIVLQVGNELDLGYEGITTLDVIAHIGYNSAYNQLRTKEQLGYIVSVYPRRTVGGVWGVSVVVQGSDATPEVLQERCEAWLCQFREELQQMSLESLAQEAQAVVAQYLERETKLSQEVSRVWGEILLTEGLTARLKEPEFDRLENLAAALNVVSDEDDEADINTSQNPISAQVLKDRVLAFFDKHLAASSPSRRVMSALVYSQRSQEVFEQGLDQPGVISSYDDIRHVKQFLSSWPLVPYRRKSSTATTS